MIPASLAVVLADTPPERRAAAIGAWSAAGALAAAAGPALGGDPRRHGRLARAVPDQRPGGHRDRRRHTAHPAVRRDAAGALPDARRHAAAGRGDRGGRARDLPGPGLGLERPPDARCADRRGGRRRASALWRSTWHHAAPAIETALWRSRPFATANLASLLYGAALFPSMLVGVLFLIAVWGYSPLEAGLAMTPGALIAAIVALRSGPLVAAGPRVVVIAGALALVAALASGVRSPCPSEPSFLVFWLPVGVLIGLGTGADHHRHVDRRDAVGPARALRGGRRPQPDGPPGRRRARPRRPRRRCSPAAPARRTSTSTCSTPTPPSPLRAAPRLTRGGHAACWLVLEERRS